MLRLGQSLLSGSGSSLLVFLPREHHPGSNEALQLLREVAVEYRSDIDMTLPIIVSFMRDHSCHPGWVIELILDLSRDAYCFTDA